MQINAPDKVKNGEIVDFVITVTPTSYQICNSEECYIQKPSFEFKTESSGILNSIMSELENPEPTTIVLMLSVLVLAGFGLYRRGQNKMKAKMYAAMVEPTNIDASENEEIDLSDVADDVDDSEEFDDIELELLDLETDEDES